MIMKRRAAFNNQDRWKKKEVINMILHNLDQDAKGVIVLLSFKGSSSRTCVQYLDIFLQVLNSVSKFLETCQTFENK